MVAMGKKRGLTLIEMLIVLGLMAGLATLAIQSAGTMSMRTRRDRTENRLDQVRKATVGDGLAAGRFVSDMGRLPVVLGADGSRSAGDGLKELWAAPAAAFETTPVTFPFAGVSGETWSPTAFNVALEGGWKGPYLQVSGERLFDGFGNNWRLTTDGSNWREFDHNDLDPGDEIQGVQSHGADNASGGTEWKDRDSERLFTDLHTATLCVSIRVRSPNAPHPWVAPVNGTFNNWAASTAYSVGAVVRCNAATNGNDLYLCTNVSGTGTSGASAPTWSRTGTVSDGTTPNDLTWQWIRGSERMDKVRVAVYAPYAQTSASASNPVEVKQVLTWPACASPGCVVATRNRSPLSGAPESASWPDVKSVTIQDLAPGTRRLFAYGYAAVGSNACNRWGSGMLTIDLKPGTNHVTVHLTEDLN